MRVRRGGVNCDSGHGLRPCGSGLSTSRRSEAELELSAAGCTSSRPSSARTIGGRGARRRGLQPARRVVTPGAGVLARERGASPRRGAEVEADGHRRVRRVLRPPGRVRARRQRRAARSRVRCSPPRQGAAAEADSDDGWRRGARARALHRPSPRRCGRPGRVDPRAWGSARRISL
jgi:hypothetical protein